LYLPPGPAEAVTADPDTPWWARGINEKQSYSARPPSQGFFRGQAHADRRVIEAVPKHPAESFRDTDIETLNREHGLDIDAKTCVFPGNGARMKHPMAVATGRAVDNSIPERVG